MRRIQEKDKGTESPGWRGELVKAACDWGVLSCEVLILVILSHQLDSLPSRKAVSLLMLTCGWEAGNLRTEERWLLTNKNNNQQRHVN